MLSRGLLILLTSLFFSFSLQAQKYTISGYVKDGENGEEMPYATVRIAELKGVGTVANGYGFYSITLEEGTYTVVCSFMGYKEFKQEVKLFKDVDLNVKLMTDQEMLGEVVITGEKEDENITQNEGSVTKIDIGALKEIPAFGGEPDVMKVAQMNPGIKTAGEGSSGFYVRGGGIDQNLVLLDGAPVYNPSHMLGLFSVFNGDALKGVNIYKGGMSSEYGGRTASVMDIKMKEGNNQRFGISGGLGIIASRLTIEAPIKKDKGSFIVSGRRTYADLFLKLSKDETLNSSQLYFYDLNLKANYQISKKDKIYISGYFGRDKFGASDDFGLNWGNATGTIRWNHVINKKLFSNTTFIVSNYDFRFGFGSGEDEIGVKSNILDYNLKQDFDYFLNNNNTLKFGVNGIYHTIEPGSFETHENSNIPSKKADLAYGFEGAAYIQNEQKVNSKLALNYGLRFSAFSRLGEGSAYEFDEEGNLIEEREYKKWESMKWYFGLEPRLSATYLLNKKSSLKLGYNRNYQFMHILSNSTTSSPSDIYTLSSNNIKPQIADQVSLGYFRNFKNNMFETSAEVYYKYMHNTIDYKNGAQTFLNDYLEGELVFGTGESYGVEFLFKKTKGKLTGWLGYTISKTTRQYDEINNGEKFSARQDRTHDVNLVLMYKVNPKITLSANFVYYTGDAVTYPTGKYQYNGYVVPLYSARNEQRMPDYHRMDVGLTWNLKKRGRFESNLNFSIYNLYGQENAYSITFSESETVPGSLEAIQLSLFRWIPSVTYNFKF